jgi:putative toxin-antitoxin system antitoxin component (TIGR02293 family)
MTARTLEHESALMRKAQRGVTKSEALRLAATLGLSVAALAEILRMSARTLQRKEPTEKLGPLISEQLVQIGEVVDRGLDVFGGEEDRLMRWLGTPVPYLDNRRPLDLLPSRFGAELVLSELGRIEHGVY